MEDNLKKFDAATYWENRYRNRQGIAGDGSGAGSEGDEARIKASIINHWIQEYEIKTINEIGCGSGSNLLLYNIPISYTGYDISPKAIEICNEKTRRIANGLKYYFTTDMNDMDYQADLCLCLDVWYHQILDSDFKDLCDLLFKTGEWKYVIIYSTDTDSQFLDDGTPLAKHVKFRKVLEVLKQYPQWELVHEVSGFTDFETKQYLFPNNKKFFLFKNGNSSK